MKSRLESQTDDTITPRRHSSYITPHTTTPAGRKNYLEPNQEDRYPFDLAACSSTLRSISSIFLSVSAFALLAYDSVSCLALERSLSTVLILGVCECYARDRD